MLLGNDGLTYRWFEDYRDPIASHNLSLLLQHSPAKSPFLQARWMQCWQAHIRTSMSAYIMFDNEKPVAAALIGKQIKRVVGMSLTTALLNQTGEESDDQVWIEYNDLLGYPAYFRQCMTHLIEELGQKGFDRFYLSMCHPISWWPPAVTASLTQFDEVPGYISIITEKTDVAALLNSLSKNTRAQCRRSIKQLEQMLGPIGVHRAESNDQKQHYLAQLAELHRQQWQSSAQGSGFDNSVFYSILRDLLDTNTAEVLLVKAGETALGYSLNFCYHETVYFYCSGVNHALATTHIKPGYIMHLYLMAEYASQGFQRYDYMGGEARYKASLSHQKMAFINAELSLPTYKGKLYRLFRRLFN